MFVGAYTRQKIKTNINWNTITSIKYIYIKLTLILKTISGLCGDIKQKGYI